MAPFLFVASIIVGLVSFPLAAYGEELEIQNRLGVEASDTWVECGGQPAVRIHGSLADGDTFTIKAEDVRGCDKVLVQPSMDASFQFYPPFTLDQASALNYASPPASAENRRLSPVLVALVGEERLAVAAGWPLPHLVPQMARGLDEAEVEKRLVALRLPGESPGKYAVSIGESTWGYREGELRFQETPSGGRFLSEIWLETNLAPQSLPGILTGLKDSGLKPQSLTRPGQNAVTVTEAEGWSKAEDSIRSAQAGADPANPQEVVLQLAGPEGLIGDLSYSSEDNTFLLHLARP